MWYKSESDTRPGIIDSKSSKKWVYVRRDITEGERENDDGLKRKFYSYEETKIPKDVYAIFEAQMASESRIDDIEEVITELIGGGLV